MESIRDSVLEKIKEGHIVPRPKWHFALMHGLLWGALAVSIGLGSLAVAFSLRQLSSTPLEMVAAASRGRWHSLTIMLPYLWFGFLGLGAFAASWLLRHTKNGYRIAPAWAAGGSVLASLLLGGAIYLSHADRPIEKQLHQRLPFYAEMRKGQERIFLSPEKGVLVGRIVELRAPDSLVLMDPLQMRWEVDTGQLRRFRAEEGMRAGILGKRTGERSFEAKKIHILPPLPERLPAGLRKK